MFTLKIENLDKLQEAFRTAPAKVAPELQKATLQAGKILRNTEVKEAPHKTGGLQRSIVMTYRPIAVEIYPTVKYAEYVMKGTAAHPIYASRAQALRFVWNGKVVYFKKVMHPATDPNPFVERTVIRAQKPVQAEFDKALENISKAIVS